MDQNSAPFWDALQQYARKKVLPFHTPGHKLKSGPFQRISDSVGEGFFALDPSDEIEEVEFNHDFELALLAAEGLAARLFGSQNTLFLINGTTGGLHCLLMPITGQILIPRFSHQSVYSALIFGRGDAVYMPAKFDPEWSIPLPPEKGEIGDLLGETKCEALVLTHPTYYGTTADLSAISALVKKNNALLFIDEAHGSHFCFSPELPPTGLESGADAVVQSTHKTLGSFTQTSMLHSNNPQWFAKVKQAQQVLQTTSPSMVFYAVLDEVRRVLSESGSKLITKSIDLAHKCAEGLGKIPGVEVLPSQLVQDPTKITFSLRNLGLTGIQVEQLLRKEYNIQVELSDYYNVLILITLGDTPETVERLLSAVTDLVARKEHLGDIPLKRHHFNLPSLPPVACGLRQAFFAEKREVALAEAEGLVCGEFLTPYPPGVPVIVPGEKFTRETIEYLAWCNALGWRIRGLMDKEKVIVLKDNE